MRILQRNGCLEQDARDIAQETLLAVWKHLALIPRAAEWAYLKRTAKRKAINRRRDENACIRGGGANVSLEVVHDTEADALTPEEQVIREEALTNFHRAFAKAMDELEDDTRLCIVLRRRGMASKKIAGKLGLTDQAVRSRLSRAKKHLRERLGAPPEGVEWLEAIGEDE